MKESCEENIASFMESNQEVGSQLDYISSTDGDWDSDMDNADSLTWDEIYSWANSGNLNELEFIENSILDDDASHFNTSSETSAVTKFPKREEGH